jgi:proton-dependent oligopeptide transporter, POT family
MAMVGMDNAADIAAAEVKGVGMPTPTLEKQIAMEHKEPLAPSVQSSSDNDSLPRLPTDEELETLRRIPAKIPWIAFTVAFVELCERFAYYGTTAVMINFIQQPLPDGSTTGNDPRPNGQPGALEYGQRASTGASLFNRFWAYFIPLIGGYLADARWGRLKTIYISIAIAMVGHIIIIVAAIPSVISNPDGALACFFVGLLFFATGVGGFKPNISPLFAEQLSEKKMHVETLRSGEQVIVDPAMTTQRMFLYFYMFINLG